MGVERLRAWNKKEETLENAHVHQGKSLVWTQISCYLIFQVLTFEKLKETMNYFEGLMFATLP